MESFELLDLITRQAQSGQPYFEFLRLASLSMGVYRLAAGEADPQSPHSEDEVYYVVSGRAQLHVGAGEVGEDRAVKPGSIVFVPAAVEHRFHSIEEDLTVLVFFAPAEYANQR
jgi:mannose-6-phosphate isomerase-like protein (cupin superfamily)